MKKLLRLFKRKTTTSDLIDFLIEKNMRFSYDEETHLCIWNHNHKVSMLFVDVDKKMAKYYGINVSAGSDYDTIINQLKKTI